MKENLIGKILSKIPYLRYAYYYRKNSNHRPGHYYSSVVNLDEIEKRKEAIWSADRKLPGIDLNADGQQKFVPALEDVAKVIRFLKIPDQPIFGITSTIKPIPTPMAWYSSPCC